MKTTTTQGLPYPEINDPANGALALQALAEAINAKLVTDNATYDTILQVPTVVSTTSADQPVGSGSTLFVNFNTDLFVSPQLSTLGTDVKILQTGYWAAGYFMNLVATGAVDANSRRTTDLRVTDITSPTNLVTQTLRWETETYDGNTAGGEFHSLAIAFPVYSATLCSFQCSFAHTNTSSTVAVKAGALLWAYRIGDLVI